MSRRASHVPAGFTLIELMVTVVLMSILAMLDMPAFTTWINNN